MVGHVAVGPHLKGVDSLDFDGRSVWQFEQLLSDQVLLRRVEGDDSNRLVQLVGLLLDLHEKKEGCLRGISLPHCFLCCIVAPVLKPAKDSTIKPK